MNGREWSVVIDPRYLSYSLLPIDRLSAVRISISEPHMSSDVEWGWTDETVRQWCTVLAGTLSCDAATRFASERMLATAFPLQPTVTGTVTEDGDAQLLANEPGAVRYLGQLLSFATDVGGRCPASLIASAAVAAKLYPPSQQSDDAALAALARGIQQAAAVRMKNLMSGRAWLRLVSLVTTSGNGREAHVMTVLQSLLQAVALPVGGDEETAAPAYRTVRPRVRVQLLAAAEALFDTPGFLFGTAAGNHLIRAAVGNLHSAANPSAVGEAAVQATSHFATGQDVAETRLLSSAIDVIRLICKATRNLTTSRATSLQYTQLCGVVANGLVKALRWLRAKAQKIQRPVAAVGPTSLCSVLHVLSKRYPSNGVGDSTNVRYNAALPAAIWDAEYRVLKSFSYLMDVAVPTALATVPATTGSGDTNPPVYSLAEFLVFCLCDSAASLSCPGRLVSGEACGCAAGDRGPAARDRLAGGGTTAEEEGPARCFWRRYKRAASVALQLTNHFVEPNGVPKVLRAAAEWYLRSVVPALIAGALLTIRAHGPPQLATTAPPPAPVRDPAAVAALGSSILLPASFCTTTARRGIPEIDYNLYSADAAWVQPVNGCTSAVGGEDEALTSKALVLCIDLIAATIGDPKLYHECVSPLAEWLLSVGLLSRLHWSSADEETWLGNPEEYIRAQSDPRSDNWNVRASARACIVLLCTPSKSYHDTSLFASVAKHMLKVLADNVPNHGGSRAAAHRVDECLTVLLDLAPKLQGWPLEDVLVSYVAPLLQSPLGILRARAFTVCAAVIPVMANQWSSPEAFLAIATRAVQLLNDRELPVRIQAATQLSVFVLHEWCIDAMTPYVATLVQQYLSVMRQMDHEDVVRTLRHIIRAYKTTLVVWADSLCEALLDQFAHTRRTLVDAVSAAVVQQEAMQQQSHDGAPRRGGDDDDTLDTAMAAEELLATMGTLVRCLPRRASDGATQQLRAQLQHRLGPFLLSLLFADNAMGFISSTLDLAGTLITRGFARDPSSSMLASVLNHGHVLVAEDVDDTVGWLLQPFQPGGAFRPAGLEPRPAPFHAGLWAIVDALHRMVVTGAAIDYFPAMFPVLRFLAAGDPNTLLRAPESLAPSGAPRMPIDLVRRQLAQRVSEMMNQVALGSASPAVAYCQSAVHGLSRLLHLYEHGPYYLVLYVDMIVHVLTSTMLRSSEAVHAVMLIDTMLLHGGMLLAREAAAAIAPPATSMAASAPYLFALLEVCQVDGWMRFAQRAVAQSRRPSPHVTLLLSNPFFAAVIVDSGSAVDCSPLPFQTGSSGGRHRLHAMWCQYAEVLLPAVADRGFPTRRYDRTLFLFALAMALRPCHFSGPLAHGMSAEINIGVDDLILLLRLACEYCKVSGSQDCDALEARRPGGAEEVGDSSSGGDSSELDDADEVDDEGDDDDAEWDDAMAGVEEDEEEGDEDSDDDDEGDDEDLLGQNAIQRMANAATAARRRGRHGAPPDDEDDDDDDDDLFQPEEDINTPLDDVNVYATLQRVLLGIAAQHGAASQDPVAGIVRQFLESNVSIVDVDGEACIQRHTASSPPAGRPGRKSRDAPGPMLPVNELLYRLSSQFIDLTKRRRRS